MQGHKITIVLFILLIQELKKMQISGDTYGFLGMIMTFLNILELMELTGVSYLKLSQENIS